MELTTTTQQKADLAKQEQEREQEQRGGAMEGLRGTRASTLMMLALWAGAIVFRYCTVLCCTMLYCTVLYCKVAAYCSLLYASLAQLS
jgi:hypothetical protein